MSGGHDLVLPSTSCYLFTLFISWNLWLPFLLPDMPCLVWQYKHAADYRVILDLEPGVPLVFNHFLLIMSRARVRKFLAFKGLNRGKMFRMTSKEARARGLARRRAFSGRMRANTWRTATKLGVELKFLDCAWNGVTLNSSTDGSAGELQPSSGCTNAISVPGQGDGESQRDGRKFTIKSIWVSGVIDFAVSQDQADAKDNVGSFFALVLDTQANGATIVSENVYSNPSTSTFAMIPQPLRNLQFSKRYKILDSQYIPPAKLYAFNDNAGTAAFTGTINSQGDRTVNLNWKGNIVVDTSGTTADVASVTDNAVHLIGYKGTSDHVKSFIGKSRVRFYG